jgi:hypothetical protein
MPACDRGVALDATGHAQIENLAQVLSGEIAQPCDFCHRRNEVPELHFLPLQLRRDKRDVNTKSMRLIVDTSSDMDGFTGIQNQGFFPDTHLQSSLLRTTLFGLVHNNATGKVVRPGDQNSKYE